MATVFTAENMLFLLEGLKTTLTVAALSIAISVVFGTLLGLARSYSKGVLGWLATAYIEIFRNTPFLLWILAIRFLVPIPPFYSSITSFSLFTSAIMAEIVRSGLNAVNHGQFESAYSQGFTFFQALWYIILPQCFRAIVPPLLSQIITVVKDTSLLWGVQIEDFTGKGMILMGKFTTSTQIFLMFGFMALVYFLINFALSVVVRRTQKKRHPAQA